MILKTRSGSFRSIDVRGIGNLVRISSGSITIGFKSVLNHKSKALGVIFGVRLSTGEAKKVREAIKKAGLKQGEWLREALIEKADEE